MRTAIADTRRRTQTSTVLALQAPIGGWNTADSLATMPQLDAIVMDNFIPDESGVILRGGDTLFATGMSGAVEMLIEYVSPTDNQLLAASDGNIYNITSGTPSTLGTGFTNAQWQTANYNTFTFFANGADTVQRYDGTTLANSTFSGVTLSTLINVSAVRNRIWFARKNTGEAWYGGLNAVSGALTLFDIGEVARAGFLVEVSSWSRDAGDGMDDLTIFTMSTGETLAYTGDVASTFTLVGKFQAPKPIGFRCTTNIGGELVVITEGGYFTLSDIMAGQIRPQDALSAKIRQAVSDAFKASGNLDGWSIHLTEDNRRMIINVPVTTTTSNQHVFNTVTKAWGRWLERNTFSIASFLGDLYGGFAGGEVFKLETGRTDASRTAKWDTTNTNWEDTVQLWESPPGANIKGYAIQAFNGFEEALPGVRNKQLSMMQPFIEGTGKIKTTVAVWTDFSFGTLTSNLQTLNVGGLFWEEVPDLWEDADFNWENNQGAVSQVNLSANAIGSSFAVAVDADTNQSIAWYSTNLTIRPGGII
ncbi:MAG: hypothetical protein JKY52_00270 [Flavobacteriales bacterium]|nr:hypothetical protein [Flavobacteriales bacterium]